MYYLAGDIGGTKALLQLSERQPETNQIIEVVQQKLFCCEYDSLESLILEFLKNHSLDQIQIESACLGLPGPVSGSVANLTNLPWVVDASQLQQDCSINKVLLINDFQAAALGVELLQSDELLCLHSPINEKVKPANYLVVGAGTGLGVAPVCYAGGAYRAQASEGGHFDFAPISETQQLLLHWLWARWEHVSYERLVSGAGLEILFEFFQNFEISNTYEVDGSQKIHKTRPFSVQNNTVGSVFAEFEKNNSVNQLTAPEISALAEQGDATAIQAMTEFVTIYGAFVGAAALMWHAPQGIYLAGGVTQKIQQWMQKPFFISAFLEKGRMTKVVANMPVYLVLDSALGLKGAMLFNQKNQNLN